MKKFASVITGILVLAVLLFGPLVTNLYAGRDIYKEFLMGETDRYAGIIRLWHVYGFQTAQGNSGADYIRYCAGRFEKRNRGVFIEYVALTPAEAEARLARCELPDMFSFPLGWLPENLENPPEMPDGIIGAVASSAMDGREIVALPYMMSGYMFMINTQITDARLDEVPEEWDADAIAGAAEKCTFTKTLGKQQTSYTGLAHEAGLRVSLAALGERVPAVPENAVTDDMNEFFSGRAALCVASVGAWAKHEKNYEAGKGFEYEAHVAGRWTDMVQYVACRKEIDPKKREKCELFMLALTDEKNQARLFEYGALPVHQNALAARLATTIADDPDAQLAEPMRGLAKALQNPAVPGLAGWQSERELMKMTVSKALSGDLDAKGLLGALGPPEGNVVKSSSARSSDADINTTCA